MEMSPEDRRSDNRLVLWVFLGFIIASLLAIGIERWIKGPEKDTCPVTMWRTV